MKIKKLGKEMIHFNAWCPVCEWHYQDFLTPAKGHRESKNHVLQTGHEVHVEEGWVTIYKPIEKAVELASPPNGARDHSRSS